MSCFEIHGNKTIGGSVTIGGAKNAVLPLFISTIMAKNRVKLLNVPEILDIEMLSELLSNLGASCDVNGASAFIDTTGIHHTKATYDIVQKMRASILVLGPLLGRFGHCEVSLPGGDAIGARPVDLHLKALEYMGAIIEIKKGYIRAKAPDGLKGAHIVFDKITVTGSENIIMAATLAKGKSKLTNVAKEPEVVQLCEILNQSGVNIKGIGTNELIIEGRDGKLIDFVDIKVIPDRIEAATYLCMGAISNSKLTVKNVCYSHIQTSITKLKSMGFTFDINEDEITINPAKKILPVQIITQEFPGFATDMQAQFMTLATQAEGTSIIEEKMFENRFMHVAELRRMGADITIKGDTAIINGPTKLSGADVYSHDLRAGIALCMASLVAKGKSKIHNIFHIDRGYEHLRSKLISIGVDIKRCKA